jgi:anti-anti-sigma regulatory factor
MAALRKVKPAEGKVVLVGVNRKYALVFRSLGLLSFFEWADSIGEAIKLLRQDEELGEQN